MRNRWLQWRRYFWVYRSGAGGWVIFIFCYGFHLYDGLHYFGRK